MMIANEPYKLIKTIEGSGIGEITTLTISEDGATIYAGGSGSTIAAIEAHEGIMLTNFISDSISNYAIFTLPQFPDNVFVGSKHEGIVNVYSLKTGQKISHLTTRHRGLWDVAVDPTRSTIALMGSDGEIFCYEMKSTMTLKLKMSRRPQGQGDSLETLGFTYKFESLMLSRSDGIVQLLDPESFEVTHEVKLGEEAIIFCSAALYAPVIVASDGDGRLWTLDSRTLETLQSVPRTGLPYRDLTLSHDGQTVAAIAYGHTVVLYNATTLRPSLLIDPNGENFSIQTDLQAGRLYVGATHSKIKVYDLNQARRKMLFVFYTLRGKEGAFPVLQRLKFSLRRELISFLE